MEFADRSGGAPVRTSLARTADALTAGRAVLAIAALVLLAEGALGAAAVVVAVGWLTDAADGALAKAAGGGTRLGEWDMPVDTAVGAGVLAGLALHGWFPPVLAVILLTVLGIAYLYFRNPAIAQALQAVAWAALFWRLWTERSPWGWVPVAVAAGIGVAERRRFTGVVLPAFFRGVASAVRFRRSPTFRLPSGDDRTNP
jgi:phosphatidylglycerophosphate synthase